jgi:hypothetical protein
MELITLWQNLEEHGMSLYFWATSLRTPYLIFLSKHLSFLFSRNLITEAILLAATVVLCRHETKILAKLEKFTQSCFRESTADDTFSPYTVDPAMLTNPGGTSHPPSTIRTAWTCTLITASQKQIKSTKNDNEYMITTNTWTKVCQQWLDHMMALET